MKKNNEKNDSDLISSEDTDSSLSDESSYNDKKQPDLRIENPNIFFNQKELCHYKNIDKFFKEQYEKNPENIIKMIDVIEGKSDISLRILDWFVTKYSKKKISCNGGTKNVEAFDVKISYKAQLKAYKKRYFDPFRRRKKFYYPCEKDGFINYENEDKHIYTTLGQLNFFKWAFSNNIVSYVEDNLNFIIGEMNLFNKDEKKKKLQIQKDDEVVKKVQKKTQNSIKDEKLKINAVKSKENDEIKFVLTFD
jgi:hypothetical protein